jgi:outer membrane protein assembly factor BamA
MPGGDAAAGNQREAIGIADASGQAQSSSKIPLIGAARSSAMRRNRGFVAFAFVLLSALLSADCIADCIKNQDHRSNKNAGLLITDINITGTQTLSSDEVSEITNELIGSCFDDNSEEIGERIRGSFQDKGYFASVLASLRIKPGDPTAVPKPVSLLAEVQEGPRYRLAEIEFVGNHAFSTAELRSQFPLKKGGLFSGDKIATGLDSLRQLYVTKGFIDLFFIPDTEFQSNATLNLSVSVTEGRQYHMGKLEIFAKKEISDRLRAEWQLPEGALFDLTYIRKYISTNRALLPPEFQEEHVQVVRDCQDATVEVRLPIDPVDPRSQSTPKHVECDTPQEKQSE